MRPCNKCVLILVVMEYSLGLLQGVRLTQIRYLVLILVVMEDNLRQTNIVATINGVVES